MKTIFPIFNKWALGMCKWEYHVQGSCYMYLLQASFVDILAGKTSHCIALHCRYVLGKALQLAAEL